MTQKGNPPQAPRARSICPKRVLADYSRESVADADQGGRKEEDTLAADRCYVDLKNALNRLRLGIASTIPRRQFYNACPRRNGRCGSGLWQERLAGCMPTEADQKHPLTLVIVVAIIIAAGSGALYMMRRADARIQAMTVDQDAMVVPVEVCVVRRVDIPLKIEARGFLSGIEEVTLRSEVAGRVVSRAVAEGDHVEAGDVLLKIDETFHAWRCQRGEGELQRAQAQLGDAQDGVRQMEARLTSAQAVRANRTEEFERIEKLYQSGHAPQIEYDRIATAFQTAEAGFAAAEAALARVIDQQATAQAVIAVAQAALGEAEAHLERCVVRSPVTGRVNRFFVEEGEYAVITAPLVEVVRLDQMKMNIELSDTEVPLLKSFTRTEVTADAANGRLHEARLHHVAPKIDRLSKKFQVELRVDNKDESLLSGMYGKAALYCGQICDVIQVPREAVFKHFGADFCLVVAGEAGAERAELRRTVIKDSPGRLDEVQVLSGLSEGDRVIVSRRRELRHGVLIEVNVSPPADGAAAPAP